MIYMYIFFFLQYLRDVTDWQIANPHIWAVPGVASGLYDYIQRSAWTTNSGFADFLYYSPVASVCQQLVSSMSAASEACQQLVKHVSS